MGETIKCPFYISHNQKQRNVTILCENIENNMGFEVKNMLWFNSLEERKDWMELFCEDRYEECPYYKTVYKKYKERKHGNCK